MAANFTVKTVFRAVDRTTRVVRRMQAAVGSFTRIALKSFAALSAAPIGTILAINKLATSADTLMKTARRLDIPVETLQEYRFVAEQSGLSTAKFDTSLSVLSKRLGEMRAGFGPMLAGLEKIDAELAKQVAATPTVDGALELIIGRMSTMTDAADKAAIANAAFGRSGLEMVNIANQGAGAIEMLRAEMRRNGVITEEQAEAAEAYNDAVNSLKKSLLGFLNQAVLPLMPILTDMVQRWRSWIVANREILALNLRAFFLSMVSAVETFARGLGSTPEILDTIRAALGAVTAAVTWFVANASTIKTVGLIVGGLILTLQGLAAVLTIINVLALANPIGLIVAGVAGAVAAFTALVVWIDEAIALFDKMPVSLRILFVPFRILLELIRKVKNNFGVIKEFFGFGGAGDVPSATTPPVTPAERAARVLESRTISASTVTIRDETGRAELTEGDLGEGLELVQSGGF